MEADSDRLSERMRALEECLVRLLIALRAAAAGEFLAQVGDEDIGTTTRRLQILMTDLDEAVALLPPDLARELKR